ncbi:hypothetical protein BCR33DRAFT_719558 [Rhizoclosmatium globosum]|uniref:DOMON domain-containing protein n=1 Tax=Rhizoclosmatium globosum TaxID=329046 RepID=A0A1Y2BZI3_9FUNG|nr:hypothetical protein BCR33DRAFT_719558 [Rhizoclosmatium globosum]|eukprot:ORY40170.1 hypothetical protein BCR33DRAFT_719558 [Rhizoclosmatium globosum]
MMQARLLHVLVTLLCLSATTSAQTSCTQSGSMCATISTLSPSSQSGNVSITIQSTAKGWAGIAFGTKSMTQGGTAYVGWLDSRGTAVVSVRLLAGQSMPAFVQPATLGTTTVKADSAFPLVFTFLVPSSLVSAGTPTIYAMSKFAPMNRDSVDSNISPHNERGFFPQHSASTPPEHSVHCNTQHIPPVTFTVSSTTYKGWIAMGTGTGMSGSNMFVAWMNGTDSVVVSQRTTVVMILRPFGGSGGSGIGVGSGMSNGSVGMCFRVEFSVQVPLAYGYVSTTGVSRFILAASDVPPVDPANGASSFGKHSWETVVALDLSKDSSGSGDAVDEGSGDKRYAGGVDLCFFMGYACSWRGVFGSLFIFIARYLKNVLGHKWYLAHVWIMVVGVGVCTAVGIYAVEATIPDGVIRFVGSTRHGVLGTVIALALYPAQLVLGYVCNRLFSPKRVRVPVWDQVHWWIGRLLVLLAVVNMHLGLELYEAGKVWIAAYWTWVLLVLLGGFVFIGEWRMGGAVHHILAHERMPFQRHELEPISRASMSH